MDNTFKTSTVISDIDDSLILKQLPAAVLSRLGDLEGTGFDLSLNQRDLFCQNGLVQYVLGSDKITVEFDK